jgi:hypothetical protein
MNKDYPKYHMINQIIKSFQYFSKSKIVSANGNPLEYLGPFFNLLEMQFEIQLDECMRLHKLWLGTRPCSSKTFYKLENHDTRLLCTWREIRCLIESFEVIVNSIDRQWQAAEKLLALSESDKRKEFCRRYQIIVSSARSLEQHIRDDIQVNVGNMSLQESRRSIQQADSIGRLSFLAFVFFPISLVTSFFGMNIQELTGTGATWEVFFASAASLCSILLVLCAWLWRDLKRVKYILKIPRILWILWILRRKPEYWCEHALIQRELGEWRNLW